MKNGNNKIHILLLGGGERVSFARHLQRAGREMGMEVAIFSYELSLDSPISLIGTVIKGCAWDDDDLLKHIHEVVAERRIDIIIPFMDAAVVAVGRYIALYGDIWAPAMKPSLALSLYDKILSAELFEENNLPIPLTYKSGRPRFPLIAKPRYGSGGKGVEIVNDVGAFKRLLRHKEDYLMQQYFSNIEEYTVDCYISQGGDIVCVSPRRRLEILGGEVSRTVTVDSPEIINEATKTIQRLKLKGAVTLQYLCNLDSGKLMLMEIDPRVGGGIICSIHAGADIPRYILEEACGNRPSTPEKIKPGTLICRYFDEAVFQV